MNTARQYRATHVFSHQELIAELESGVSGRIADALVASVRYGEDWRWVQEICLAFLTSDDVRVRWAASITLVGNLWGRPSTNVSIWRCRWINGTNNQDGK